MKPFWSLHTTKQTPMQPADSARISISHSHLIYRIFRSIRWDRESESHVNAPFSYSHLSLERFGPSPWDRQNSRVFSIGRDKPAHTAFRNHSHKLIWRARSMKVGARFGKGEGGQANGTGLQFISETPRPSFLGAGGRNRCNCRLLTVEKSPRTR